MKWKTISVLLIFAMLSYNAEASCTTSGSTCEPRSTLALQYLNSIFGDRDSALEVWLGGDYGPVEKHLLEARENHLERLGRWALTLKGQDRSAYLGAISFYEDGAKEAYAELHAHALQKRQAAYDIYLRHCAEIAAKSAASHPLPKPPEIEAQP